MERLLDLAQADVLVCGYTHIPFHRILSSGRRVVNAGSRGSPKGGNPEACYIVRAALDSKLVVKFRCVLSDIVRAAKAIEESDMRSEYGGMLCAEKADFCLRS